MTTGPGLTPFLLQLVSRWILDKCILECSNIYRVVVCSIVSLCKASKIFHFHYRMRCYNKIKCVNLPKLWRFGMKYNCNESKRWNKFIQSSNKHLYYLKLSQCTNTFQYFIYPWGRHAACRLVLLALMCTVVDHCWQPNW